ncbi:MAG: hypothetical protein IJT96_06685 [Lachnospiraceae bacterium]|nr:hypothetical protein [Lachnospiraceae bacterium]
MLIRFKTVNGKPGEEPVSEICTFEGIRYEQEAEIAILSTEHRAHDYLLPMRKAVYEKFVDTLYNTISRAMKNPGLMVEIRGSSVLRVKHGSLTRGLGIDQYKYEVLFSAIKD